MRKLNILKENIKRYKWLSLLTLVFAVAIPLFVLAENTPETGYKAYKNAVSQPMFYVAEDGLGVERVGFCVGNSSGNDYFVPTPKFTDIMAFVNNRPSGISFFECSGDGQCTGSESCNNPYDDCGPCSDATPVDSCSTNCTSSCPCASNCIINCSYSSGGGGGGGSDSCSSFAPNFFASC